MDDRVDVSHVKEILFWDIFGYVQQYNVNNQNCSLKFEQLSPRQVSGETHDAQKLAILMACKRLDGAKTDSSGKIVGAAVLTADRFDTLCSSVQKGVAYFQGLKGRFPEVYEACFCRF